MKYLIFTLFLPMFSFGQSDTIPMKQGFEVYEIIEERAEFIGGEKALFKYLTDNVKPPENPLCLDAYIVVQLRFIVEKDGSVENIIVLEEEETKINALKEIKRLNSSLFKPFNESKRAAAEKLVDDFLIEAKRVVASQPKWKAGTQKGRPVRSYFTMPIKYKFG